MRDDVSVNLLLLVYMNICYSYNYSIERIHIIIN
jgi:hypothetical protein